ncbi:MAG: heavy metal-binding domain-containing protein, partial [Dongiaceae bacterium]
MDRTAAEAPGAARVVDPVCGMTVDPAKTPHRAEHDGRPWFFCSAGCRGKFLADPARYDGAPAQAERHAHAHHAAPSSPQPSPARAGEGDARKARRPGAIYTCPMHPEVRQEGPGACPDCGMALEPALAAPATRIEYTCPMHPEIVQDHPGNCPICGMALEPRT